MKMLNEDIESRNFRQIYLLYGEELYLRNQYKNRLKEAILQDGDTMNFSYFEGEKIDVSQVIAQAETLPFFAEYRLILIEDSGFFEDGCPEEFFKYLPKLPQETILLFAENKADRRTKLFKFILKHGRATEFRRQDARTLRKWVAGKIRKEKKNITEQALERFLDMAGDDMNNIFHELEKLLSYTMDQDAIGLEDVEAVCNVTVKDQIFKMIRAVAEQRQKQALDLYYDLLALKKAPFLILSLLAKQFNQILYVKDLREQGLDSDAITGRAGVAPFIVKECLGEAGRFTSEELEQIIENCVSANMDIKAGRIGDRLAVEMLLIQITQRKAAAE